MAKLCSRPPGFAAPFCWGDFCGTRLQNRLDRVAVDFACPPAGSINSACQIFSLLCWAHSVAEQCINIHGDQSRASGEREYGAEVCGERERKRERQSRDIQPELSKTTHNQQSVIFSPTSLCWLKQQQWRLYVWLSDIFVHDFNQRKTCPESHYLFSMIILCFNSQNINNMQTDCIKEIA